MSFNTVSIVERPLQTDVETETYQSPCPLELSLKRRISEPLLYRGGDCEKRKRISAPVLATAVGRPCSSRPNYRATMSESCSRKDSTYSTLPTTPPTPGVNETDDGASHLRRPSQVAELLEKTIARLKRIFGSRRGSIEDGPVPSNPCNTQRSSISQGSETQEEQAWKGAARLPHVSMYFDANGEEGPSLFYTTADWDTFQTAVQARRTSIKTRLHNDMQYDGGTEQDEIHKSVKQKRRDSQFSFGGLLKSGRFSKIDKGKEPMAYDDTAPSSTRDSPLASPLTAPLDNIGILPRSSADSDLLDAPKAECSDAKPGQRSPDEILPPPLSSQLLSIRMVTPAQSHEDLVSPVCSDGSSTSSSSIDCVTIGNERFQNVRRLSESSAIDEGSKGPEAYRKPLTHENLVTSLSSTSSSTNVRHSDRPDTASSSPPLLRPTTVPSLDTMQTLSLGPPSQALLSSSYSNEGMFRLSVEHLAAPARPAPLGPSSLARTTLVGENGEDKMDFSITHPAPPSPAPDLTHPVRRRKGSLKSSGNLRSVYVEQGGSHGQTSATAALTRVRKGRLSSKKSLQDQCWWGDEEVCVSPPRQYL